MPNQWIDYTALKQQTGLATVLEHYGINPPKRHGGKIHCCFPGHVDKTASLSIDTRLGQSKFQCFGCGKSGNILDFVMIMDDCSLMQAATKVAELRDIAVPYKERPARGQKRRENDDTEAKTTNAPSAQEKHRHERSVASQSEPENEPINPPLSFTLKLDATHPYVGERLDAMNLGDESLSRQEIVEIFGLGVASRGMMKDRLAIPIHDEFDALIGYAGRWALPEDQIPEDEEKYKLPPRFKKSHALFNLHRILAIRRNPDLEQQLSWVVVTEGYFGAIRLHALNIPAVSVMGTSISDEQIKLIDAEWNPEHVILLFDGDEAGKTAAAERVLPALANRFFIHNATAVLDDNEQPDEMTDSRLLSLMKSLTGW